METSGAGQNYCTVSWHAFTQGRQSLKPSHPKTLPFKTPALVIYLIPLFFSYDLVQTLVFVVTTITTLEASYAYAGDEPDHKVGVDRHIIYCLIVVSIQFNAYRSSISDFFTWKDTVARLDETTTILRSEKERNEKLQEQNKRIKEQIQLTPTQRETIQKDAVGLKESVAAAFLIDWDTIVFHELLGSGSFGDVYRGTLEGETEVAIKRMRSGLVDS